MDTGLQFDFGPCAADSATGFDLVVASPLPGSTVADDSFGMHLPAMNASPVRKLLIVDGHAYAYRAFYAIRELKSPVTGQGTNAVYGFIRMLGKVRAWLKPTHLVVIWDGGLAAERMEALPEYKAQRPSAPPDLNRQIDEICCWLAASGIASVNMDGVEADDCIATLARSAAADGAQVIIASSDKDFMQLVVDQQIGMLNPNDKTETLWFEEQVRAKMQVTPAQIVDYLALLGDAVDNIPGVPGIGSKTAASLLQQFGSVDELYRRLGEVKSEKIRNALQSHEAIVRRNFEVVRLRTNIECDLALDSYAARDIDRKGLREFYERCGFRTLLEELMRDAALEMNLN